MNGWDGPWHSVTQDMSEFMFVVKFLSSFWTKEVMALTISFSISHPCWSSRLLQPLKSPLWGFTGWFEELTIVSIVIYHHCFINYCCHQMSSNRYICHEWLLLSIVPPMSRYECFSDLEKHFWIPCDWRWYPPCCLFLKASFSATDCSPWPVLTLSFSQFEDICVEFSLRFVIFHYCEHD